MLEYDDDDDVVFESAVSYFVAGDGFVNPSASHDDESRSSEPRRGEYVAR